MASTNAERRKKYYLNNRTQHNLSQVKYKRKLRLAAIAFLGGKCIRCGFNDVRALQIDHINGGGLKELRKVSPFTYYKKILIDTEMKYQLLCANCNWIKREEKKEW